jgi:hypothetical protein
MSEARKRPCCICRRWFRPNPRVGSRQRACDKPECQAARRVQTQKSWRDRNPDYFMARRIQQRSQADRRTEPLRLPAPLNQLPWDIAQDQFDVQGADFIGLFGKVLLRATQDQFRAYLTDKTKPTDTLQPNVEQNLMRPVRESVRAGTRSS